MIKINSKRANLLSDPIFYLIIAIVFLFVYLGATSVPFKTMIGNMLPSFPENSEEKFDEIDGADEFIDFVNSAEGEIVWVRVDDTSPNTYVWTSGDNIFYNSTVIDKVYGPGFPVSSWGYDIFKNGKYQEVRLRTTSLNGGMIYIVVSKTSGIFDWHTDKIGVIVKSGRIYLAGNDEFYKRLKWTGKKIGSKFFSQRNGANISLEYLGENGGPKGDSGVVNQDHYFNIKTNMVVSDFNKLWNTLK